MKRTILFATETTINNGNGYYPADIRRLYNIPNTFDGASQSIGILEFSNGYSIRDAAKFWSTHNIATPQVKFISVDGTRNDSGKSPDDEEASLDLQWAGALAPKATLLVYEANGGETYAEFGDALLHTLQYILNDEHHKPSVLSISYGDAEVNFRTETLIQIEQLIAQLDATGVTVCIASGDQGAYGMHDLTGAKIPHADAPATCPSAVAVGGTSLQPDGHEAAWTFLGPENGGATGGGFSSVFDTPDYQQNLGQQGRGIPDVALNADPATGYQIIFQGEPAVVGGTSVACPVMAAMVALANQARVAQGKRPVCGLAKTLYGESQQGLFRDIVRGNNTFNGVQGYEASAGWDACTGHGSLDASQFIEFLVNLA